nr:retrovirus-related Pol polyprotein from transposon TNT 1-94 [Tanacetum cinerariifolium]
MAVRDYDDTLVCCVEVTIEDRIIDSAASFHATYCKEELKRFKLHSDNLDSEDCIPGLKRRLISVGKLDEEGYHVSFEGQQWKVTKGSLVVTHGNKRRSLYMVEVPSNKINIAINGRGNANLCHQRLKHMSEKGMKILASKGRIPNLQKAVVGFCEPCVLGKQKKVDPANMLPLSMTTTKSSGESSNTSEGSKNSRSFEDFGRSDKEDSKDGASFKEEGSETPHVQRSNRESMALIRFSPSANYLLMTESGEPESYSEALSNKESVQ